MIIKPITVEELWKDNRFFVNNDWDEGGGYTQEAVVRELNKSRLSVLKQVRDWGNERCHNPLHDSPDGILKRLCFGCWRDLESDIAELEKEQKK